MIDGRPTRDLSVFDGMHLLSGAPGTKVSLVVIRGNAADPHAIDLIREAAAVEPADRHVDASPRPASGYIRDPRLHGGDHGRCGGERRRRADQAGAARSSIIDFRQTAEGPFDAGRRQPRDASSRPARSPFARRGMGAREELKAAAGDGAITMPVDRARQRRHVRGRRDLCRGARRATSARNVIGERTHGRAGIQKLVRLPEGHGLWLTYAAYLTPAGEAIHEKGLKPTIEVDEPDVEFGRHPIPPRAIRSSTRRSKSSPSRRRRDCSTP